MAVTNTVGAASPAPEKKRQQEKATVGLMIELYCRGHHGTPKAGSAPTARSCGTTPTRGWTTARI